MADHLGDATDDLTPTTDHLIHTTENIQRMTDHIRSTTSHLIHTQQATSQIQQKSLFPKPTTTYMQQKIRQTQQNTKNMTDDFLLPAIPFDTNFAEMQSNT